MFDYDARPATPQVVLVGQRTTSAGYALRDFLSRNRVPYEWIEIDDVSRIETVVDPENLVPDRLPTPVGAEIFNNTSRTLERIGLAEMIERSRDFQPLRLRLYQMDHEMQRREMRQLAAAPDFVVGSAHAVTMDGSLLVASASGSQLGPLVSGPGEVILVVGGQKVVADVATGLRRIREYCFPLEDQRARAAYGVPSGVNNVLIINQVVVPGRITTILVDEVLGF